jgi:SdrD B-like domain
MRKFFTTIGLILTLYGSFAQTFVNGTITNHIINQPVNGSSINLFVSLVHLNNGNPNDLALISVAPVGTDGTYSFNDPLNTVFGSYKLVLSNNPSGSISPNLPPGFIWFEDYNDPAPDGISGTFLLSKPLCTGDVGDPEYDDCMAYVPTVNNANFKLSQLPLIGNPSISSNSPVCVGGTLNLVASDPNDFSYTVTGPNGQPLPSLSISNVTLTNAGTYTVTSYDLINDQYLSESTNVVINPLPPTITFTSGATTLNQNAPNQIYSTDAPNTFTVSYAISPSNTGTISATGVVDWENTFTGQAIITASITNTCGTKTTIRNVDILAPTLYSLGNTVFYDMNKNGMQDIGEVGIPGLTVTLYQPDGVTPINTNTTDVNGNYLFENLIAGDYIVGVIPSALYSISSASTVTSDDNGGGDGMDNGIQIVPSTEAKSPLITLNSSDSTGDLTVDFGFHMPAPLITGPSISTNSPLCEGQTLLINANSSDESYPITVTGPNGQIITDYSIENVTQASAGMYTVTMDVLGDPMQYSENVNVVINPLPPNITFITGATALSQNAPNEIYSTDAPNTFTVTYTISPSNAGTINGAGMVDWDNAFHGQATISASITNTCGTKTATSLVNISCLAPLNTFSISSNSPICAG